MFVKDTTGTDRDEYLSNTDPGLNADAVVGIYCGLWSIETTFQECRPCVGLETTRGRTRKTVYRVARACSGCTRSSASCTTGCRRGSGGGRVVGQEGTVTFLDALTEVRHWNWAGGIFPQAKIDVVIKRTPSGSP